MRESPYLIQWPLAPFLLSDAILKKHTERCKANVHQWDETVPPISARSSSQMYKKGAR